MEIKKRNIILKFISAIFTIIVTIICIAFYYKRLLRFINIPAKIASTIIFFLMFMFVLYKFIFSTLKLFANKKIIRGILLILLVILAVIGICFIKNNINYLLRNVILMLIFILGVVCLPIIILGISLLSKSKSKIPFVIFSLILLIFNYYINFYEVMNYAETIVNTFSCYSLDKLFTLREKEEQVDTSYLENYTQKYAKNGYLSQFDIKSMLDIIDSKSMEINVNYEDKKQNSYFKITNKDDEEMTRLKESLKSDFYKFNYENNDNNLTVNIERYIVEEHTNNEKNEDVVISGTLMAEMVNSIDKYFIDKDTEYFTFENELIEKNEIKNRELESFKMLLAYDEETQNYVPILEDLDEYELINSYKVYSTGLEITLEDNVTLKNEDYSLRINRYDSNFNTRKNWTNTRYFYEYEPVVETMTDSKNRTVLYIKFDMNYTVRELNNIEIIFGN